jgi:hypothetical protein
MTIGFGHENMVIVTRREMREERGELREKREER